MQSCIYFSIMQSTQMNHSDSQWLCAMYNALSYTWSWSCKPHAADVFCIVSGHAAYWTSILFLKIYTQATRRKKTCILKHNNNYKKSNNIKCFRTQDCIVSKLTVRKWVIKLIGIKNAGFELNVQLCVPPPLNSFACGIASIIIASEWIKVFYKNLLNN